MHVADMLTDPHMPAASPRTMPQQICLAAGQSPRTPLLVHSETRPADTTLGELYDESLRVAGGLRGLGIEPGDVVAVQLPNWRECFVTHAAAWLCGAILLPIVPIYGRREVEFILRQSRARAFIAARSVRNRDNTALLDALVELPTLDHRIVVGDAIRATIPFTDLGRDAAPVMEPHDPASPDERCLLVYTSGTTSVPKGVQHTHASLLGEVEAMRQLRGGGPEVVSLAAFPSGHIAGVLGIARMLTRSTLTVAMDAWDPSAAARLIVKHGVQASGGAPIHLSGLLDVAERDGLDLSSLQEYTTGAASVTGALIRRADRLGIVAFRSYGSTEHPTISSGRPSDPLDKRADTDGRLAPGSEVRIVDEHGVDVAAGQPGEILSRGPELFAGYFDSALTAHSMVDGWFRTGDIGAFDADGYLVITDRKKDIIVRGGENISSKEVEDVLMSHPAVAEAAAIGAPDERLGERVCVFVVLNEGHHLDVTEIQEHFSGAGLARQKTPEQMHVVTDLPRTASGKVQKQQLRQRLSATPAGQPTLLPDEKEALR
jgi:cyclohexanecarboxylate-CoA ligase